MADSPRWVGMQAATLAVTLACGVLFQLTEVGQLALVDQWERTAVAFGQEVDDRQYSRFEDLSEHGEGYAVLSAVAGGPGLALGTATLLYVIFSGVLGGPGSFRQVLAVVVYAGVILAARQVLATPISYVQETMASPTTLTMFFPMLDEASPAARFFGIIDVFVVWWIVAIAIGVSVVYRRPARPLALGFLGAYVGFALVLAVVMALTGGIGG